jgi:hypothetical protein
MFSFSTTSLDSYTDIPPGEAKKHIGEKVKVCGKVTDTRFWENSSRQTQISMGGNFLNQQLTIIINLEDRKNFSYKPEVFLRNKSVCVSGKIVENNGRTELIVTKQDDIRIEEEEAEIEIKANDFNIFNKFFNDK